MTLKLEKIDSFKIQLNQGQSLDTKLVVD